MAVSLKVNGRTSSVDVDPAKPLLWVLREDLGILGPKYGCGLAQCGACTVHIDGVPMRSCITPVSSVGARSVTTIEAMEADPVGRRVQAAWSELDVAQCGYCQAGQIMSATALIKSKPRPTDEDINTAMNGNLCRCATYTRIRKAIKRASGQPVEA
jgi:isoquinoline 1-oxidoreductase alpha subunit